MKEAYAVRRTVPPSAEIQASIDKLLGKGMVDDPQKMLSELARLGAQLIIQRAVEEEFDSWWVALGMSAGQSASVACATMSRGCATFLLGLGDLRVFSSWRSFRPSKRRLRSRYRHIV